MKELLREMELVLTDLLQSGLDTGGKGKIIAGLEGPSAAPRLRALARQCGDAGLHTGAALLTELETALTARAHTLKKNDQSLMAALCRAARYLALCREKLQEESIAQRWQQEMPGAVSPRAQERAGGDL